MGVDFNAGIFYGAQIKLEIDDWWDFVDEFNENNEFVEIINVNPMDEAKHVIFIKESWKMTDDTSDSVFVKFADLPGNKEEWDMLISVACEEYMIEFPDPDWHFVSYYS